MILEREDFYCIGMNVFDCIEIHIHSFYDEDCKVHDAISRVVFGGLRPSEASCFETKEQAEKLLIEIKANQKSIVFTRMTVFDSVINGNFLDCEELKVFKFSRIIECEGEY